MDENTRNVHGTFSHRKGVKKFYFFALFAVALAGLAALLLVPGTTGTVEANGDRANADKTRAQMLAFALDIKSAGSYAVYAEKGVRDNGTTRVRGTVGVGTSGELRGLNSDIRTVKAEGDQTHIDLANSYSAMRQLPCSPMENGQLGGQTVRAGIYCLNSAELDGTLILNANGDPNASFIFRVDGNFVTRANSKIELQNGAQAQNVYVVSDTATIGDNNEFRGNLVTRNDINIGAGSIVKGRVLSVDGTVESRGAELGGGTGYIEICKAAAPNSPTLNGNFSFSFNGTTVNVPVGSCSGPIEVPAGNITVTEGVRANVAVVGISTQIPGLLVSSNFGTRSAVVNVREGGVSLETVVTFVNQQTRTGVLEICKYPALNTVVNGGDNGGTPEGGGGGTSSIDVQGTFLFTVQGLPNEIFAVPVGQCSGPITTTTLEFTDPPFFDVLVTEIGLAGFSLEHVTQFNSQFLDYALGIGYNEATNGFYVNPGGGVAQVELNSTGGANNMVILNFFNRANPGLLKICKVAGPGVPEGRIFRFNISGTGPNPDGPPFYPAGVPVEITDFEVAAGPAAQGGLCRFVDATFVIGTPITIVEQPGSFGGPPLQFGTNADLRVSRIQTFGSDPISLSLENRSVTMLARREIVVAEYTNFVFRPSLLKICKIAGPDVAVGTEFTFDVTLVDPQGLFPTFSVPALTVQAGPGPLGYCQFAQGPYTPTGTVPPIGTFNRGSQLIVTERASNGTVVTAITSPTGGLQNIDLGGRSARITLDSGAPQIEEIAFTNAGDAEDVARAVRFDFDGDRKADPAIFTPATANWAYRASSVGYDLRQRNFGISTDIPVAADYDRDGRVDHAVYRNGNWYIGGSTNIYRIYTWGVAGDVPQAGDFDGDGKADLTVFRPSNGTWYMNRTRDGFRIFQFGIATDKPIAADYDGDGAMDAAVFRNGTWYIYGSNTGFRTLTFGVSTDVPVPADYDGDGKADIAVYRPSNGNWYIQGSAGAYTVRNHGNATDRPVPADFDGDGKTDLAVFRPSEGKWYIVRSSQGDSGTGTFDIITLGNGSDITLPSL